MSSPFAAEDRAELTRLSDAVRSLIQALSEFEDLSQGAQKTRLSTEKNLTHVAREIQRAIACQETVDAGVRALMEAIQGAQRRHAWNVESLRARAEEVQRRAGEIGEMQDRFNALGEEVRDLHECLKAAFGGNGAGGNGEGPGRKERVREVQDRMGQAIGRALALRDAASGAEMFDIAREAENLRGSMESARKTLERVVAG